MDREDLDMILLSVNSQRNSWGDLRYLTNYLVCSFYDYLLIPREGVPTFVAHYGGRVVEMSTIYGYEKGVQIPWNPTNSYERDGVFLADLIRKEKAKKVGIVGFPTMSAPMYLRLTNELAGVQIKDVTNQFDEIQFVKSKEEMKLIKRSAAIGDLAMEVFRKKARPGRKVYEVIADVDHEVKLAGSEDQFYLFGSEVGPSGNMCFSFTSSWNRTVKKGDTLFFLAEISGPGGYYSETCRTFVIGKIPKEVEKAFAAVLEAQKEAVKSMKEGVKCSEVGKAIIDAIKRSGYPLITHAMGHGQGIDIYERPTFHPEDDTSLQAGMEFSIPPRVTGVYLSDNFMLTDTGPNRWQKTPQEVLQI